VTPAMNNTRGVVRNPPATYPSRIPSPLPNSSAGGNAGAQSNVGNMYNPPRATTPNRYYGAYNAQDNKNQNQVSSTGLIRLTLRKPMGIVFEPMYDPNQVSVQRGVRICDLPRTGAAALSRKLEVGDELLSINDKTMSRLTFDEIMDFIIEADPEQVNLLFRRPRKEVLVARVKTPVANTPSSAGVKWVDDDDRKKSNKNDKGGKKETKSRPKRSKRDDETVESEFDRNARSKSRGGKAGPYENESFLDLLIDTICANPDSVCKSKRGDDDYYSDDDDDRTFNSQDDSTYVTYDESERTEDPKPKKIGNKRNDDYSETDDDNTFVSEDDRKRKQLNKKTAMAPPVKESKPVKPEKKPDKKVERVVSPKKYYEEDATLETIETKDRPKPMPAPPAPPPLGLAPKLIPLPVLRQEPESAAFTDDDGNPAPISTLEYDDFDHGADVSVMESLGGPSLLIEKQRQAMMIKPSENVVPSDIVNTFAQDYPAEFGLSREQTIQKDPLRFYTYVVKLLLEAHEPEKVRLLDKLLAKYKGREDHLVQKLSVRYNRLDEGGTPTIPEEDEDKVSNTFAGAVISNKESPAAAAAVATAKERAAAFEAWGDDRLNVADEEVDDGDSVSASGSEFSGESIDGTSPAVIAQVSELLNYVYGKTSVPGQIDRVSTIMRAYEGREAVLLELLETKALIKANSEKENAVNLPSFLRNSPSLQHGMDGEENPADEAIEQSVSPLSSPHMQNQQQAVGGNIINDDISSMSGVSSPAPEKKNAKVSLRGC
jgi:PDZ domain